jgi:hypothetical protein
MTNYALLVGSNYPNTPYPLRGCLNDINFLKIKLTPTYKTNIIQLTDGTLSKPTRDNILKSFTSLLQTAQSGDTLFFGYSGHGSNVFDSSGDEKDKRDEVLVTCDKQAIIDDDLKKIIDANLKADCRLFCVFDSCHSGSMLDLKYQYLDADNSNNLTINSMSSETKGQVIMISGSRDSQTSEEAIINKTARGAMLWSFLQVINKTPKISYVNLLTNIRSILKKSKFTQVPQLSAGQALDLKTNFNFV